nr:MAG TPA: hypothetical protein [Caudoviricetes sp.]
MLVIYAYISICLYYKLEYTISLSTRFTILYACIY